MARSPWISEPMRQGLPSPPGRCGYWRTGHRVSSERRHFCRLSLNVRPMAIASPTLFIVAAARAERRKLEGNFEWRLSAESRYVGLRNGGRAPAPPRQSANLGDDVINATHTQPNQFEKGYFLLCK